MPPKTSNKRCNSPSSTIEDLCNRRTSTRRKKVASDIIDVENSAYKAADCIRLLEDLLETSSSAQDYLLWLDANPQSRNLIMSAPPLFTPAFTTQQVLDAHIGPHAQAGLVPHRQADGSLLLSPLVASTSKGKKGILAKERVDWFAKRVLPIIWVNFPTLSSYPIVNNRFAVPFAKALLGPQAGDEAVHVKYQEINRRMQLAEASYHSATRCLGRPTSKHAAAWLHVKAATLNHRQILMDGCAAWYPKIQQLAATGYLDVLARVTPPIQPSSVENEKKPSASNVEHLDVKDEDNDHSLGSIFHWKNCFSPAFYTYALETAIPTLPFMRDGMKTNKNRLSRISYHQPGIPFSFRKEKPYLMLSDTALFFESQMLRIGNFLNKHLHRHLKQYVEEHYGHEMVPKIVPPLHLYDCINSSINSVIDGAFALHNDSGNFVSDNNLNYGDAAFQMQVPTFFWSNRDDAETTVSWKNKKNQKKKYSIQTTTGGCHLQTIGLQDTSEHWSKGPTSKKFSTGTPLSPFDHRLLQSLRSTARFQDCHHKVLVRTHPNIMCVGDPPDYNFHIRLGEKRAETALMGTPIRPDEPSAKRNASSRPYFTKALVEQSSDTNAHPGTQSVSPDIIDPQLDVYLHVTAPKFSCPSQNYANYPQGHARYLKSPFTPHRFFSSGPGLRRLHQHRISPCVHFPGLAQPVAYGLAMHHVEGNVHPRAVCPGRVYPATAIYTTLGLSSSQTDSQVWHQNVDHLTGVILTKQYKNQFPIGPVGSGEDRGPLLDYRRLTAGSSRLGFWIGGQGGASELIGQVTPELDRPSSLEAAILEHPQKAASSSRNNAMAEAARRKSWIRVYLKVGAFVPESEVDFSNSQDIEGDTMEKVVDLGAYEISRYSFEDQSIDQLRRQFKFQAELDPNSDLKIPSVDVSFKRFSRFLTQGHYQFNLIPIQLNDGDVTSDWRYLNVSSTDTRRIQVLIPTSVKLMDALSVGDNSMSAEQVYDDWVHRDKLHVNFLNLRTPAGVPNVGVDNDREVEDLFEEADESLPDYLEKGEQLTSLPEEKQRVMSAQEAMVVLNCISVGGFLRLLQVNVDDGSCIRPLVDPGPDHDFVLTNYHRWLVVGESTGGSTEDTPGTTVPSIDYLPRLGQTVQRNVFPHPVRTYDVATLHLIYCTGGGHRRQERNGFEWLRSNIATAADFLIHSIIIRCLGKTHALKCWAQHSRGRLNRTDSAWFLPGVDETTDFLDFVRRCVQKHGQPKRKNQLHDFTSDQFLHTLDDLFKSVDGWERVLQTWAGAAKAVLENFITANESTELHKRRDYFICLMMDTFKDAGCGDNGNRLKFVCSQVVADLDELMDGLPFGPISKVCGGPGSHAGRAVLQQDISFQAMTKSQLLMFGLERDEQERIRVIYHKRLLSLVDSEHCECKTGIFVHRLPGGGRASSDTPRRQVAHCHPIPYQSFEDGIAGKEREIVAHIAQNACLAFKDAVRDGTWVSPEGILGETCWSRPDSEDSNSI